LKALSSRIDRNLVQARWFFPAKESEMTTTTDKKKGDFGQWQREDKGGHKKAEEKGETDSRTAHKEPVGHGGRD
jgi:hypothetical protein